MAAWRNAAKIALGFSALLVPPSLRRGDAILMLHRVVADDRAAALPHRRSLQVGVASFERMLRWLATRFDVVDLETMLTRPGTRRPRVALTFDDGWRDNADVAWPVLKSLDMPASIFLSTAYIGGTRCFWWESLGELLWRGEPAAVAVLAKHLAAAGLPGLPADLPASSRSTTKSLRIAAWLESLKELPADRLTALAALDAASAPHAMDWPQVQAMEASGLIRFGAHGHSHAILTGLSDDAVREEVRLSRAAVAAHCRAPLPVFCYPNGNHDARVMRIVAEQGYRHALSTRRGWLTGGNAYSLPRIGIGQAQAGHRALLARQLYRQAH